MPNHLFECNKGHIFQEFVGSSSPVGKKTYTLAEIIESRKNKKPLKIRCKTEGCKSMAHVVYMSRRRARNALSFQPSVFYYDSKTGHIVSPGRANFEHLPKHIREEYESKGYQKKSLGTFREYESFRREHLGRMRDKYDRHIEGERQGYKEMMRERQQDLERGFMMRLPITNDRGDVLGEREEYIPPISQFEHQLSRELYEQVLRECDDIEIEPFDDSFYIDAFENDNPYYRDADTGERKRWV